MIFLTVGTQFPFDRLVKAVDEAVGKMGFHEEIFAQVGTSSYRPKNFKFACELEKSVFDKYFSEANSIISHAGIGTITMALESRKPLLVMPRLRKYREVVNDHQLDIARKFEQYGYLLAIYNEDDLSVKMQKLKSFVPKERRPQPGIVAERIAEYIRELSASVGPSAERRCLYSNRVKRF